MVGIWGHSALGKTTWLKSIMDELADITGCLVVVLADNAEEYYHISEKNVWLKIEDHNRWQGTREQKLHYPPEMMIHNDMIYIVESMRWFNGLQPVLIEAFKQWHNQGLHMIIPYAQGVVHQEFIHQRCLKVGKKMSDWWTVENCDKEANYRLGSIEKWWKPNGVPAVSFEIDAERKNWQLVTEYLKELLWQHALS